MRRLALVLGISWIVLPAFSQDRVTIEQLRRFLEARGTAKLSDDEIANRLASVTLSERLTESSLKQIGAGVIHGPHAAEQLYLLADRSSLEELPSAEHLALAAPTEKVQKEMLTAAHSYVDGTLRQLPDFIATRSTRCFGNTPAVDRRKKSRPDLQLHLLRRFHHEIAYRDGHELIDQIASGSSSEVFTTRGEYGPILSTVLGDISAGTVAWNYWEKDQQGDAIAVFRYDVPRTASHYLIDFCCYQNSEDSGWLRFRDKPAYHGEISIQPGSGRIERITIEAELDRTTPIRECGIEVSYGAASIAGKQYFVPLHGSAVVAFQYRQMKFDSSVSVSLRRQLNETDFLDYHKFGSSSRIIPVAQ